MMILTYEPNDISFDFEVNEEIEDQNNIALPGAGGSDAEIEEKKRHRY